MSKTAIQKLGEFGQSVWLDNISRSLIETGKLKELIGLGLRGMTSNPTIFDKAISSSSDYDKKIEELGRSGKSIFEIYDDLTVRDVREAADIFKPVYEKTSGLDGYVSLEINPKLALKSKESIEEGRRLYKKVHRPNVMFKVPATEAGLEVIEELLAEGMNINATLIFSLEQYRQTSQAFIKGLARLSAKWNDLKRVHSVASIFVSRVDTAADKMIEERLAHEKDKGIRDKLDSLKGKAAVANSSMIFQEYLKIFEGRPQVQRVLWASTGTKNPAYSDIKYVTELMARNTVNTMPDATLASFLDHGAIKEALSGEAGESRKIIVDLKSLGIDVDIICEKLLREGVEAFEKSFDSLLKSIELKARRFS